MNKILRIVSGAILTVIVLFIAAIIILVNLINPNDFKREIGQYVQQKTGRSLTIGGDIHWSFFPWLGVKINKVDLGNSQGFKQPFFAKVGEADISVRLLPLFSGSIRTDKLTLKDLYIYMEKNQAGKANWQDLVAAPLASTSEVEKQSAKTTKMPKLIVLSGIDISNANISWDDYQAGQHAIIENFNLKVSDFHSGKPFDINGDFDFSAIAPEFDGHVEMAATVNTELKSKMYNLSNLKVTGNILGLIFQQRVNFKLQTAVAVDLVKQTFMVNSLTANVGKTNIIADFAMSNLLTAPTYSGQVNVAPLNILEVVGSMSPKADYAKSSAAYLKFSGNNKEITIPTIKVNFGDSVATGAVSKIDLVNNIANFNYQVNKINLDHYAFATSKNNKTVVKTSAKSTVKSAPVKTQDISKPAKSWTVNGDIVVGSFHAGKYDISNISTHVNMNNNVINLSPVQANLYGGSFSGSVVVNLESNIPAYNIKAILSGIQLKQLLVATKNYDKLTGVLSLNGNFTASGVNIDALLRSLNSRGSFQAQNGTYYGADPTYVLRSAYAMLTKRPVPQRQEGPATVFQRASANYTIQSGVLSTNNFAVDGGRYQITGGGTANLVSQQLNFGIKVIDSQGSGQFEQGKLAVPVKVTGTFQHPKFTPDYGYVLRHFAIKAVQETAKSMIEGVIKGDGSSKDIGKNIGNQLKKTFGF